MQKRVRRQFYGREKAQNVSTIFILIGILPVIVGMIMFFYGFIKMLDNSSLLIDIMLFLGLSLIGLGTMFICCIPFIITIIVSITKK